jgi:mannose-6-phosphate isomerase-like protein (cupin superfamily)
MKMSKWICKGWELPSVKTDPPVERFIKMIHSPEANDYKNATVLLAHIPPGSTTSKHAHPDSDEIMYFLGRGEATLGDEKVKIENDLVVLAPKGVEHEARNTSDTETLKVFCVFIPPLKPTELLAKAAQMRRERIQDNL